ncbi:MAG: isoprenylcysteine carboxylmethyltransferase family protein, partial [Mesorhizobium sp.]
MTDHQPKQGQPKSGQPKPGLIPWPPVIYLAAIAVSIALGWLYPLPWIGGLLGDILFAAGWVALFGV